MVSSRDFYKDINGFSGFSNAFDVRYHHAVPDDWCVVLADVKGSTQAVAQGRYKDINVVGASCIIAVLNAVKGVEVPYVFGGDGASFLVPEVLMPDVAVALLGARDMARDAFGIDLRVGAVGVSTIMQAGKSLKVSKYCVSEVIDIAMFHGGGLAYAEDIIKADEGGSLYGVQKWIKDGVFTKEADFTGLECRWNPVAARKDDIVTLMVSTRRGDDVYQRVMEGIDAIYGESDDYKPVHQDGLSLSFNPESLRQEHRVQTSSKGLFSRVIYGMKMAFECVLGAVLFKFDLNAAGVEGRKYVRDVALNTDFQKFDDMLRVILDSTNDQTKELMRLLEEGYHAGDLFYGANVSASTMMTCLIFERTEKHLHFVDGMAGGYTMAAKAMKAQMSKV